MTQKNKRLFIFCDKAQTSKRLLSNRAFSTTSKESLVNWRGADAHRVPESKIPKEAAELHVYLKWCTCLKMVHYNKPSILQHGRSQKTSKASRRGWSLHLYMFIDLHVLSVLDTNILLNLNSNTSFNELQAADNKPRLQQSGSARQFVFEVLEAG